VQQPARAYLSQFGLSTLRKQVALEGASEAQIEVALDSDDAKQQMIEMVFQAQRAKVAEGNSLAELTAKEDEILMKRQELLILHQEREQKEAVQTQAQAMRVELAGLGLGALEKRARLVAITSDLVDVALDDDLDAKKALIELCIEAEFGAFADINQRVRRKG
jgi:hypothetical protein